MRAPGEAATNTESGKITKKRSQEAQAKSLKQAQPKWLSNRYVNVLAWLLLTVGLCIIISTFYLAISQGNSQSTPTSYKSNYPLADKADSSTENDNELDVMADFEKRPERRMVHAAAFRGCEEHYCKVGCLHASDVYESLDKVLNTTTCLTLDFIAIEDSEFPHGYSKHHWHAHNNLTVREVVLRSSNVSRIRTDAFNAPMFADTIYLMWWNLKLDKVDSGALLGLLSLKYLIIDTTLPSLDRSFFQPVQTTLRFLKLNARLHLHQDANVFGISIMEKLEYADLSYNNVHGALTKRHLQSMPNLRYLIMTNAKITSIETGALSQVAGKLQMINLSLNFITILSPDAIEPLLASSRNTFINLSMNTWHCYCLLAPFARLYTKYRQQFLDAIYCKAPHSLYGTSIVDINFENCSSATGSGTLSSIEIVDYTQTTELSNAPYNDPPAKDGQTPVWEADSLESSKEDGNSEDDSSEDGSVFQMRCLNPDTKSLDMDMAETELDESQESMGTTTEMGTPNTETTTTTTAWGRTTTRTSRVRNQQPEKHKKGSGKGSAEPIEYLLFEPPAYDFTVDLLGNGSVMVAIANFNSMPINVIWFSEQNFITTDIGLNVEHNCMGYITPYLVLDDFVHNTTYTFCLMSYYEQTITPFNCLPLFVPAEAAVDDGVWLRADSKPLTVSMLCLIFIVSALLGAAIAYFGIKSYPDLLEGSRHVLVVRQCDQNDYVSTITETDYQKNASFKRNSLKCTPSVRSYPPNKPPLPLDPPSSAAPSLPPFCISSKNLERLSSVKSSSTCFEDPLTFLPTFPFTEEEYVLPKDLDVEYLSRSDSKSGTTDQCSSRPPPLPKRNSSNAEGLHLAGNRFNSSST